MRAGLTIGIGIGTGICLYAIEFGLYLQELNMPKTFEKAK